MKKYRFLTREELEIKEPPHWNPRGQMDYLLGTKLSEQENREFERRKSRGYNNFGIDNNNKTRRYSGDWTIDETMLRECEPEFVNGVKQIKNGLYR